MAYNTGNPIGSLDPRDAADNKENFDRFALSAARNYTDRLGVQRKTVTGTLQDYAAYNLRGAWTTATAYNVNDIWRDGPTGAFYLVLADYTSGASAAADIAGGNVVVHQPKDWVVPIETVSDLRAFEPSVANQQIELLGHTNPGVGGGIFWHDASDTTTADDNGVTIVTAGGKRWKRKLSGFVTPQMFGGIGDGVSYESYSIQLAVDFITNVAGSNPRQPRASYMLYIPRGQYLINSPILLYQKDGIQIVGEGSMVTQFIVNSSMLTFTYPTEWQSLPDFSDYQSNPAVFQVAQRRVTGVGNPGDGGVNLNSTGYSQAGAGAAAWYYTFKGVGFYARDTVYSKTVHCIYGKEIAQVKIDDIYAEGMDHCLYFKTYTSEISNVRVFDCVKPAKIEDGTSLTMNTCGAAWCDEGWELKTIYSTFISLACDHWGVGSFAYDVGAISQSFIGCGSENGFGGILRINGGDRCGCSFESCVLQGGVVEGAINDTGQTSVSDFGVIGMIEITSANATFNNCAFLSEILRGGSTTFLGAHLTDSCDVIIGQSADKLVRQTRVVELFGNYVAVSGTPPRDYPAVKFTSDYDRDVGAYYNSADIVIPSNSSVEPEMNAATNPYQDVFGRYSSPRFICKTGGRYRFTFSGVLEGDQFAYVMIQNTTRPSGEPIEGITRPIPNPAVNDQKIFSIQETFQLLPGDQVRPLIRHFSSANAAKLLANAVFSWEQI